MRCPHCHVENQAYAAFCLGCGESLVAHTASAWDATRLPQSDGATYQDQSHSSSVVRRPSSGSRFAWEKWAVLALVAVLLMAGAADLIAQQGRVDSYRAGRTAEAARHWDTALAAYGQAGGYEDSTARSQAAGRQVTQRNQLYAQGRSAADSGDWPAAATALEAAATVEPDYADLPQRLVVARHEITNTSAVGLIFRRDTGAAPGLYMQGVLDHPAQALAGSDGVSLVRAFAPDGTAAVYDGANGSGPRRLYLALLAPQSRAGLVREVRPLPAGLPLDGTGIFCPGGLWWIDAGGADLRYYDLRGATTTPLLVGEDRRLLGVDPGHGGLLLAEAYRGPDEGRTRILRAAADGTNPRIVADSPGIVTTAALSPDGRWLAYQREQPGALVTYGHDSDTGMVGLWWDPSRAGATTTSLMLTWVGGDATAIPQAAGGTRMPGERMLDHFVAPDDQPQGAGIVARFAPGQPATLVADRSDREGRTITIYEAATGVETTFWPAAPPLGRDAPLFSPRGSYLLVEEARPEGVRLSARPLGATPRTAGRAVVMPAGRDSLIISQITPHDDYLLYLVVDPYTGAAVQQFTVFSLSLAPDKAAPAPEALIQAFAPISLSVPRTLTLAPGGALLAYLRSDGLLFGLPLDGAAPLPLASDVGAVWSPVDSR